MDAPMHRGHRQHRKPPTEHPDFTYAAYEGTGSYLHNPNLEQEVKDGKWDYGIVRLAYLGRLIEPGTNGYHFVVKGGDRTIWSKLEQTIPKIENYIFKQELVMWYEIAKEKYEGS